MSPPLRTRMCDLLLMPVLLLPYLPGVAEVVAARLGWKASAPQLSAPTPNATHLQNPTLSAATPAKEGHDG